MHRKRVAEDRETRRFEAKSLEDRADRCAPRDIRSKSPRKSVVMASSSDLP